ncbi:MAG TPA: dTDP-glucose 4,6-dehydratase [Holophagaceae bacterium]|jgi:dTDP-glucose 4,6-dehydratase|nr:dTDP-glucose 4,6-dehydratase [Holophagaceae bacterium]
MGRILITGGAGFIGSNFVHFWRNRHPGDEIVVLDKLTYAADPSQIEGLESVHLVQGDVADAARVREVLDGVDRLVHFAAESHVDRSISGPAEFIQTNLLGTFTLLEEARRAWAGDPSCRFLHVSTDEVFGSLDESGKFTSDSPYRPNSPYSASKAGADHLVRAYGKTYGLPVLITNCSNNYGPRQHPEKLIPKAITALAVGKPVPVYGDGLNIRDWLFVDDHCEAISLAVERGLPGSIHLIGGDCELTNLDLLGRICERLDRRLGRAAGSSRSLLTFVPDRPGHDRRYAIDTTAAKQTLGWSPRVSLDQGLDRTIACYLGKGPN